MTNETNRLSAMREIELAVMPLRDAGEHERARSLQDAADAVAELIEAATEAAKLLDSVAPHHPQTANLRSAIAHFRGD